MKKAIFFTIDSLLASGIIIISILLVSNFYISEHNEVNVNYASQDLVRVFSSLTIGEVKNDYAISLIASGQITNPNNTLIEQIGQFWAENNIELARNLTINLTESIIPKNYGFSIVINDETIYARSIPTKKALVSSRRIISGIAKLAPTEGFTSRVTLSGIKSKRTNAYAYFGGYEGDGNLTKVLVLPTNIISFNSSYLEVDAGGNFDLYINGIFSGAYKRKFDGGSDMIADAWNISNAYLSNFVPGTNTITLNFTGNGSSYIAGGLLRVTYITSLFNDTQTPGFEKYLFPGIKGVINLYSSIYSPSAIGNMNISLHFLSNYQIFLRIGNTTLFESNSSPGEVLIVLNNFNISSSLDYNSLGGKTLPLRLGLRNISISLGPGIKADAALITDRTASMGACDVTTNCTAGLCDSDSSGGCHDRRDNVAIKSDKKFVDTILGTPGNKVGLIGFGKDLNPVCDFHDFSDDNASLKYRLSNYSNEWCGYTCISCGIVGATQLLTEKEALYGSNEIFYTNATQFHVGDSGSGVSVTEKMTVAFDMPRFLKSRLVILGRGVATEDNYSSCVYFNNKYIGRMCEAIETDLGWHTCQFPLKPEWFVNGNIQNVTITGGTVNGCMETSGDNNDWDFKDVKLTVWKSPNLAPSLTYAASAPEVQIGDAPFQAMNTTNLIINVEKSRMRSASLELEAIDVNASYYNCVYVNGNFIGQVDYQKWNGTNQWQRALFDVPVAWMNNGLNQINITSGTTQGCKRTSGDNDEWRFRNVNLSVVWVDEVVNYDRSKSMLVMSDGEANTRIGDCSGCDVAGAGTETIEKACEAFSKYGIRIYTVAFGNAGQTSINTLNRTACCDDCSHFFTSTNSDDLVNIYAQIAQSIVNIGYQQQSINISSGDINKTVLYPDSYITFNYTPLQQIGFNKIPLTFETERFGNNISSGILTGYPNTSVIDAKVTSYSGSKWTDNLIVNGNNVYRLSDYGSDYLQLGDPFVANIPAANLNAGSNAITISTGTSPANSTGGSPDNRIIYTLLLNAFSDYTAVVGKSDGCSWAVAFEDGTALTIKVPSNYNGADVCSFATNVYDPNDALDIAAYGLFSNLDFDKDKKLDVNIDQNNLEINTLTLTKVPSLWGPAVIEVNVWE